jgi:hypothetical protein
MLCYRCIGLISLLALLSGCARPATGPDWDHINYLKLACENSDLPGCHSKADDSIAAIGKGKK